MKEDKDLLKELLQTKFKDDVIASSGDNFDHIFDAVQEKPDDKNLFFWYTIGVIFLMLTAVVTLSYFMNTETTNTNIQKNTTEHQVLEDPIKLVTKNKDNNILSLDKEKNDTLQRIQDKHLKNKEYPETTTTTKKIDITTLESEDEINETGVITVTYTASKKYASTEQTKYNTLPDSSTIVVRKNSKVNFTASKRAYRRVTVEGTVFFNVRKDTSKPFIIFGKHSKTQITGRSLAIHSDSEGDLITLIDGSAKVVHNSTKEVRNLVPGESIRLDQKGSSLLERSPNRFAWETRTLHYQNTSIKEVINDLGENYDAKIILKNADIQNCRYSGSFKNTTTEKVLIKFATQLQLKISKEDDVFMISGKGCK